MAHYLRRLWPLFLCTLAIPAGAATDTIQNRKPTVAELSSFARFFHRAYPDAPKPPALAAWRRSGERRWRVESTPFALAAPRATGPLCSSEVVQFSLDGQWHAAAPYQQVWLDGPGCASEAGRVRRAAGLADQDVIRLLQRQQPVLARARLLMAGNSVCAKERSSRFFLASILSRTGNMVSLEFHSDRPVVLTVSARQSGPDYDVWEVHCTF